jgi:hypothetical protein
LLALGAVLAAFLVCAVWGLLCLLLSLLLCLSLGLCLLCLFLFVLWLPVLVFLLRLLWLVVLSRPLPLFLLLRVLCLLSLLLTLVVLCALLVVARSVACGLPWVVVLLRLLLPWSLLSGLLVALVLPWTCGVLPVVLACLAPVTFVLSLLAEGLSRLASLLRSSESVFARALPVAYRCCAVRPLRGWLWV